MKVCGGIEVQLHIFLASALQPVSNIEVEWLGRVIFCVREVSGSILGSETGCLNEVHRGFLYRQKQGWYLKTGHDLFFPHRFQSIIHSHPTIHAI